MVASRTVLSLAVAVLALSACAETKLAIHTAKRILPPDEEDVQKTPGVYKIGKPYPVQGVWYYPAVDYDYRETGIASWYGPDFHGKVTANGETFNMNEISAAHRTLPLPSVVRVVNLRNGRSLEVRLNDRGPFARNRIIDLSRRAAQLLGFEKNGTAPVRVEILADESRRIAALAQGGASTQLAAVPTTPVSVVSLDGPAVPRDRRPEGAPPPRPVAKGPPPAENAVVRVVPVSGARDIYVQAGSFVQPYLAERMQWKLSSVAATRVVPAQVGNQRFYRVRVGPVNTVEAGDALLNSVIAHGYPDARIVVED
ncbi:MAG: septal ring lytic transglycosylase RlpA family protein [Alphaproteobacteria bacterium]|nr:septal ring lytic transglycosylase RlpA family protein [Alphaproteobacteria bacterium]